MPEKPQLASLTGIRYFAAAAVLLCHFVPAADSLAWAFHDGYMAVPFFFVLSGAVLSYSHYEKLIQAGDKWTKRFLARRFARIYPCYLFAFAIGLVPFVESQLRASRSTGDAVARIVGGTGLYLTLVQAWFTTPWTSGVVISPAWSLSCEWFFYVSFCPLLMLARPTIAAGGASVNRAFVATCIVLAGVATAEYVLTTRFPTGIRDFWGDYFWRGPFGNLPYFVGGVFIGRVLHEPFGSRRWLPAFATWIGTIGLLLLWGWPADGVALSMKRVVILPISATAIYGLGCSRTVLARVLGLPFVALLGEASYPLYLLQFPLHEMLGFALPPLSLGGALVRLIVFSAISVLVAVYIERPSRQWITHRLLGSQGMVACR